MISKIKVYTADYPVNGYKRNTVPQEENNGESTFTKEKNTPEKTINAHTAEEIINRISEKRVQTKNFGNELKQSVRSDDVSRQGFLVGFLLKLFIEIAIWIFIFMIIIAVIIFAASKTPKKTFLGYSCYAIADECLEPDYNVGDCIITGTTNAAEIEVGDFITFIDDDGFSAGIVDSTIDNYKNVNAKFFRVKDAYNNTYVVEPKDITGKELYRLPDWGYIVSLLGSKTLYN